MSQLGDLGQNAVPVDVFGDGVRILPGGEDMAAAGADEVQMVDEVDRIAVLAEHFHQIGPVHIGGLVLRAVVHHIVHV